MERCGSGRWCWGGLFSFRNQAREVTPCFCLCLKALQVPESLWLWLHWPFPRAIQQEGRPFVWRRHRREFTWCLRSSQQSGFPLSSSHSQISGNSLWMERKGTAFKNRKHRPRIFKFNKPNLCFWKEIRNQLPEEQKHFRKQGLSQKLWSQIEESKKSRAYGYPLVPELYLWKRLCFLY